MVCYEKGSFATKEQINGKERNPTMFSLEVTQNWHTSRRCSPALLSKVSLACLLLPSIPTMLSLSTEA